MLSYLVRLYALALGRTPDLAGITHWQAVLADLVDTGSSRGAAYETVARAFLDSREYALRGEGPAASPFGQELRAQDSDAARVDLLIETAVVSALTLAPDPYLVAQQPSTPSDDLFHLYRGAFGRDPDLAGFSYWLDRMAQGLSLEEVAARFLSSREFQLRQEPLEGIDPFYTALLGREATRVEEVTRGGESFADVLADLARDPATDAAQAGALKDWMRAQGPDDVLGGSAGRDTLIGGPLSDVFVFVEQAENNTRQRIADFEPWDLIDLRGQNATGWVLEDNLVQANDHAWVLVDPDQNAHWIALTAPFTLTGDHFLI